MLTYILLQNLEQLKIVNEYLKSIKHTISPIDEKYFNSLISKIENKSFYFEEEELILLKEHSINYTGLEKHKDIYCLLGEIVAYTNKKTKTI